MKFKKIKIFLNRETKQHSRAFAKFIKLIAKHMIIYKPYKPNHRHKEGQFSFSYMNV